MGSYGKNIVSARVGQGLNYALEDAERTRRARAQERRAEETHGMRMQQGQMQLDAAQAEAAHKQFAQDMDQAIGRLVVSQGTDTQGFEEVYNRGYPDGHEMRIERQPDGKFVLDFGPAGRSQPMELDQLVGLGTTMKNPQLYYEEMQARQQREQEQADTIATEDRAEQRKIAAEDRAANRDATKAARQHKYALELKQTPAAPGLPSPKFEVDDKGNQNLVSAEGVQPLPNPEGSTFKDGGASGRQSATVQDIEYFLERLPVVEGESKAQRFVRAVAASAAQHGKHTTPQEAVREFEETITAKLIGQKYQDKGDPYGSQIDFASLPPAQQQEVKTLIRGLVEEFAQRYSGNSAAGEATMPRPTAPPPGAQTATNPQTGEKVFYDAQSRQWVPY